MHHHPLELAYVHAAAAHRSDPEAWVRIGTEPGDVVGLLVTLRLQPGGFYRIEVKGALLVMGAPGAIVALAPFLVRDGRRMQAAWKYLAVTGGMLRVEHPFAGIPGAGRLLTIGLTVRTNGEGARYSSGFVSALASRECPITAQPGIGRTLRLA